MDKVIRLVGLALVVYALMHPGGDYLTVGIGGGLIGWSLPNSWLSKG